MSHAASDGVELGVQRCSLQLPLRWKHDEDRKQKGSRISCCVWSQKQSGPIKSQLYFPFPKKQCAASGALRERGDHHTWNQISCWFTCDRSLSARCRSSTSAEQRAASVCLPRLQVKIMKNSSKWKLISAFMLFKNPYSEIL